MYWEILDYDIAKSTYRKKLANSERFETICDQNSIEVRFLIVLSQCFKRDHVFVKGFDRCMRYFNDSICAKTERGNISEKYKWVNQ